MRSGRRFADPVNAISSSIASQELAMRRKRPKTASPPTLRWSFAEFFAQIARTLRVAALCARLRPLRHVHAVAGGEYMRKIHLALVAFALLLVSGYALAQQAPAPARPVPPNLPEW